MLAKMNRSKYCLVALPLVFASGCTAALEKRVQGLQEEVGIVRQQLKEQNKLIADLRRELSGKMTSSLASPRPHPRAVKSILGRHHGHGAVRQVGLNRYEIDRSAISRVLANPAQLAMSVRVVPHFRNGKAAGFKLFAIRPRSFFAKLGWKNGDVVVAINGMSLTSPSMALSIYTKLRSVSTIAVDILRRGRPLKVSYTIK